MKDCMNQRFINLVMVCHQKITDRIKDYLWWFRRKSNERKGKQDYIKSITSSYVMWAHLCICFTTVCNIQYGVKTTVLPTRNSWTKAHNVGMKVLNFGYVLIGQSFGVLLVLRFLIFLFKHGSTFEFVRIVTLLVLVS